MERLFCRHESGYWLAPVNISAELQEDADKLKLFKNTRKLENSNNGYMDNTF